MVEAAIASVDRRVEILEGSDEQKREIRTVSQLRQLLHVVVLGEPGSGKTTVLQAEAVRHGTQAIKVRALLNGERPKSRTDTFFLDALDEYRSDGQEADKACRLAAVIREANAQAWWLSCRAEDWRKEADIAAIRNTTGDHPITVVQLLPLNYLEAADILRALGESSPEDFLDKAESLGADGFIQNPLSLRLLRAAVQAQGAWPSNRFDLFDAAVRRLAHEKNPEHKFDTGRPSPDAIIAAAEIANLMLMASGGRAIWRSNDETPGAGSDARAYVRAHDLNLDRTVIDYALDTALFRGEGEAFEPMHRTIAEFTAARALARSVRGGNGRAAYPLSRALALITGQDGKPPTELRGLYAWFAAHLSRLGDRDGALRLIEADAPSVLTYGDAAAFDTESRREILLRLTESTPYPRSHESGTTSAGGLAGEDLAEEFSAILRAPLDGTQRTYTVLEALQTGPPVLSLKPLLHEIALSHEREEWVRKRAADAWLNGQMHPAEMRRSLFDALAEQPISRSREAVRLHLAESQLSPEMTTADLRSLVSGFRECGRDNHIGRLHGLQRQLERRPRPDLFEQPIRDWLRENTGPDYQHEIDGLLDHALAACIRGSEDLAAERLLRWVMNATWYDFPHLEDESKTAIREWVSFKQGREIELFYAIMKNRPAVEGAHMVVHFYSELTGQRAGKAIVRWLLEKAVENDDRKIGLLKLAISCVSDGCADPDDYWKVVDLIERTPEMAGQVEGMRVCKIEGWRLDDLLRRAMFRKKQEKKRIKFVKKWMPVVGDISIAKRPGFLDWGAHLYFQKKGQGQDAPPAGIQGIADASSPAVASAVVAGWRYLFTNDFAGLTAADIAKVDAENNHFFVEYAALAGLDMMLDSGDVPAIDTTSIVIALSILRNSYRVQYDDRRRRIEAWAISKLIYDIDSGANAVLAFLRAALAAGATDVALVAKLSRLNSMNSLLCRVLLTLLEERPAMPEYALRQALAEAGKRLSIAELGGLLLKALAAPAVRGKSRRFWQFLSFAIEPKTFDNPSKYPSGQRAIFATLDLVCQEPSLIEAFDFDDDLRPLRNALIIDALGRFVPPSNDWHLHSRGREEVVRKAINMLGTMADTAAGSLLSRLIAEPALAAWRNELMHARFQHRRLLRDRNFRHPSSLAVGEALAGKAPVNAADLRAVVMDELRRLQRELRAGVNSPWKHYWNTDGRTGRVIRPKIENHCRDLLLERLGDRLNLYGIVWAMAEVRHPEDTRADIAVLSHTGKSLPIEIKRDSNAELWYAAENQLMHYAQAETAEQVGIYLVFWFDHPDSRVPPRMTRGQLPASAVDLERMLSESLSAEFRDRIDVIVFDVSDPDQSRVTRSRSSSRNRGVRTKMQDGSADLPRVP